MPLCLRMSMNMFGICLIVSQSVPRIEYVGIDLSCASSESHHNATLDSKNSLALSWVPDLRKRDHVFRGQRCIAILRSGKDPN